MADSKLSNDTASRGKRNIPLTPSNVVRLMRELRKWWKREFELSLVDCLFIPRSKQDKIRDNFPDEMDQKKQAMSFWINTDPLVSWRTLITALDRMSETKLADSIRFNAEPLTDITLTVYILLHAVSTVRWFWDGGLLYHLGVPRAVINQITSSQSYSSEDEKRVAGLQYYLQTVPGASWGRIAGVLWYLEEHTALETVREYLPHKHDPSITLSNLTLVLESFPHNQWERFGAEMDVPESTLNKIESQFHTDSERKTEVLRVISTEHPHLTWEHVADALYLIGCHSVLERLQTMFPTSRRRAKQIYEEEMKRRVSKRQMTKVLIVGTAGSGKSTSLETVMDEKPLAEEDRESTPLLKRTVQTEVVYIDKDVKWVKRTPEEKKRYIVNFLRARAKRLNEQSPTPVTPTSVQSPTSTQQSSTSPQPIQTSATPTSAATTATTERSSSQAPGVTIQSLLQSSEVDEELISLINIPSDSLETIVTERVVYIVDSGGQPEFMEAMAVFLGETSACILVIDLSQSLDGHPLIGYYRRGKAISKPYRCTRTNEENLKQCLRTMNTFTSKTKGPLSKLLFLGTHRDKVHKCLPETVSDKNARLKKIIPEKFQKQIISLDKKTLIFEMNALNPDDIDKKTAQKIRSYILEQCPAKEVEIPIRWDTFEEKLRMIAEGLGRMVMSREECWQVAESVGLDEGSFDEALDFFHSVSLMFYFKDILNEVVFVDPQVILDKVSELIEFMFELRQPEDEDEDDESSPDTTAADNPPPSDTSKHDTHSTDTTTTIIDEKPLPEKPATTTPPDVDLLPPGWQQFEKFGHITKPFLNAKRFSSHYHTGIFTSDDVIHLLEQLLVFAKLSTDDGTEETWFMPSVLKQVPAEKMEEVCVSCGPLVIDFPDGGPQNGIFCSLMSHVLSPLNSHPHPWKLCLSSNEPTCLYRNCIEFHVPDCGSVTLMDHFEYFEVHVSHTTSDKEQKELWQHVEKALFSGIESVSDTLGYSNNKPRPAIICPKSHTDRPHAAYIKDGKWNCTNNMTVRGTLKELNTEFPWCEATCKQQITDPTTLPTTPVSSTATVTPPTTTSSEPHTLDIDDLFEVQCELDDVTSRWKELGLALRLRPTDLQIIETHRTDPNSCFTDILTKWLQQNYNTDRFGLPSWKLLVDAVAHRRGGNNPALARQIATKHNVTLPPCQHS